MKRHETKVRWKGQGADHDSWEPTDKVKPKKPVSSAEESQSEQSENFEMEKIVDKKYVKGEKKWKQLIKWKNYDDSWNTWEPMDNIIGSGCGEQNKTMFDSFNKKYEDTNTEKEDISKKKNQTKAASDTKTAANNRKEVSGDKEKRTYKKSTDTTKQAKEKDSSSNKEISVKLVKENDIKNKIVRPASPMIGEKTEDRKSPISEAKTSPKDGEKEILKNEVMIDDIIEKEKIKSEKDINDII